MNKLESEKNNEGKEMLNRIVAMLTKLGGRGYSVGDDSSTYNTDNSKNNRRTGSGSLSGSDLWKKDDSDTDSDSDTDKQMRHIHRIWTYDKTHRGTGSGLLSGSDLWKKKTDTDADSDGDKN